MNRETLAKLFAILLLFSLVFAGCDAIGKTSPQALPTVVLGSPPPSTGSETLAAPSGNMPASGGSGASGSGTTVGGVTASGVVAPAQIAQLGAAQGGMVMTVSTAAGGTVKAGQVLVTLAGREKLTAAVESANMELLSAQQALNDLKENADQSRAQAQLRLAKANDDLDQATKRRGWKNYRPGSDTTIATARADLIVAEDTLKKTKEVYGGYVDSPEDNLNKAAALSALSAAQKARDKALANLNYLLALPNTLEVSKADAELEVARVEQSAAQREYDKLKNGPDPDALALAEERVKNAEAQLAASRSALADLELKAPFDGTISKVNVHSGEWVIPGQALLELADVAHLRVETTDLSERDVPNVAVGQPVTIFVKALNQTMNGHVSDIALLADTLGGDVVYKTTIDLDAPLPALRAGMSADVRFNSDK